MTAYKRDFRSVICTLHQEQSCCLYCTPCEKLVCPTCIAKDHIGHNFVEIKASYTDILKKLDAAISDLEVRERKLDENEKDVIAFKEKENEKFSVLQNELETQRQTYKQDIDDHFDKINADVIVQMEKMENSVFNDSMNILEKRKDLVEMKKKIESMHGISATAEFFSTTSILFADLKAGVNSSSPPRSETLVKFVPKYMHLPGEVLGSLKVEKKQVMKQRLRLRVKQEFVTELNQCVRMAACYDRSLVIVDSSTSNQRDILTKIQIQGDRIKTIFSKELPVILDIEKPLTTNIGILLADRTEALKAVNVSTGDIKTSRYNISRLHYIAVHVTMDNKVVVGAVSSGLLYPIVGRRVVIVMDSEGRHQAEWEYNKRGDRLFSIPRPSASVLSGNIFVGDILSKDGRGKVTILSPTGDVLNTYTGHPDINDEDSPFGPRGMTRTPADNVIVCDYNALHLLDNTGVPLSYFSTVDFINYPYCVAYDTWDCENLYIGCATPKDSNEKAQLYRVSCTESE